MYCIVHQILPLFTRKHKVIWEENLAVYQKSLRDIFQAPLHFVQKKKKTVILKESDRKFHVHILLTKLNFRLCSDRGIPALPHLCDGIKFKGKGHEVTKQVV